MRWLLIDEVIEIQKGKSARCRSRVPAPGEFSAEVLMIEMMAQCGGILLGAENDYKDDVVFGKIEAADFPMPGVPGEPVEITATAEMPGTESIWVEAQIANSRGVLASAKIMLLKPGALVPGKSESTTFHPNFMQHFKVKEKVK